MSTIAHINLNELIDFNRFSKHVVCHSLLLDVHGQTKISMNFMTVAHFNSKIIKYSKSYCVYMKFTVQNCAYLLCRASFYMPWVLIP